MNLFPIKYKINNNVYFSIWCEDSEKSLDTLFTNEVNNILAFESIFNLFEYCEEKLLSLEEKEIICVFNLDYLIQISKLNKNDTRDLFILKENECEIYSILTFLCDLNRTYFKDFKIEGVILDILDCFYDVRNNKIIEELNNVEFIFLKNFIKNSINLLNSKMIKF